jgi:hypothetical protein
MAVDWPADRHSAGRRRRSARLALLEAQKIDLSGCKSWCESNDPQFAANAADIVGLYMAPPENAIVICVDEKPSIQALERCPGLFEVPHRPGPDRPRP